ncbi:chemotaxis protein CheA [Azospirillum sp. RWY-5-1]|uniref:histidine kinase n=1 Tax=Azospirillum oleiclasticum TaxID=2735135 RepID=A0ABX2TJB0_9PROT|nr:chemotaxis protein CheA [Azospirillum oleiclasticum]NYZ16833.1 chemotaxis protein CheA [Azospirillum oleiclasticum]NYZ24434.1 chemotaxis protein CheA [Azospirillum oleiclasticum]
MNALLGQFLTEGRDLLAVADDSLLRLERDPADSGAVNELFRAFHTLKGGSALFDLPAFTALVHAGEDVLDAVRAGRTPATSDLADRLLAVTAQCARWMNALEAAGRLPADAADTSRTLAADLRGHAAGDADMAGTGLPDIDWLRELSAEERRSLGGATLTAVTYDPDPDCFFNGDDPLELCRSIPELRLLRIEPAGPWPPVAEIDPYRCVLRFRALSAAGADAVRAVFRSAPNDVRIITVRLPEAPDADGPPAVRLARAMLREQARILTLDGDAEEVAARRAAALRAAGAILAALGRHAERKALEAADAEPADALAARFMAYADAAPLRPGPDEGSPPAAARTQRRTLRVEPERIDRLMALLGELVTVKGALPRLARDAGDGNLGVGGTGDGGALAHGIKETAARLDAVTAELQHAVLTLRLVPLARIFEPLPRLIREASRRLGKQVELRLDGSETEADKDVLDTLGEPLLHLVRNALDHGIEDPERRRGLGKPETGTIGVSARQERDGIVVSVSDDGAGIDPAALRRKAVERGLAEAGAVAAMTDAEALRLVFLPGLSTAADVSDLSGRGVGMDAVASAVHAAGGRVEIDSAPGHGTTVRLLLPLTTMVTRVLVVEAADQLYGLPVASVTGMSRVPAADIRRVKHAESILFRGAVVPLFRLRRLLGMDDSAHLGRGDAAAVAVLDIGGQAAALAVDRVRERADVIVRPMAGVLSRLRAYRGTAVLADGRLLLVLDPRELL